MNNDKVIELLMESTGNNMYALMGLNEAQGNYVNEEILAKMFDAIGEKYNEIDFKEIEASKGNYKKFKYMNLVAQNTAILRALYNSDNHGDSETMKQYVQALEDIQNYLVNTDFTDIYDIPFVAIMYNTMVTNLIYSTTLLISATVRFVTIDKDSTIEVIVDNLPKAEKNIFLGNLLKLADMVRKDEINKIGHELHKARGNLIKEFYSYDSINNESFVLPVALIAPVAIYLVFKIVPIIREIIYAVYSMRVSMEKVLEVQIDLLNANIEGLDYRQESGNKKDKKLTKVITKQKKVVDKLTKVKNFVAIKFDIANVQAQKEIKKDNPELNVSMKDVKTQTGLMI